MTGLLSDAEVRKWGGRSMLRVGAKYPFRPKGSGRE